VHVRGSSGPIVPGSESRPTTPSACGAHAEDSTGTRGLETPALTCHSRAEDGIRTRDPHLGKVVNFVGWIRQVPCGAIPSTQFPARPPGQPL
jgi:hypothetical protein